MEQAKNTAVTTADKGRVTYQVAGQDVTLSFSIVRNYLTRGNGNVTDQELVQFISICKYQQLNPFLNEAYLVKFAGANPVAQMIVSKEALMKKAEACDKYDGIQAGIIVERNGEIVEEEGCFSRQGDKLLGGWAKVFRSDRKYPIVARVNLNEYDKGQSIWKDKKNTMIAKVAKVQALREAFPAALGAMYTQEEVRTEDATFEEVSSSVNQEYAAKANQETVGFEQADVQAQTNSAEQKTEQPKPVEQKQANCPF